MVAEGIEAEIQARMAPTQEVNPNNAELPAVFPRLDRVTPEALAIQHELLATPMEINTEELDHLQDH